MLLIGIAVAGEPSPDHRAPVETLAPAEGVEAQRQNTLVEMWQRRILSTESRNWTTEDMELLQRVRAAERAGAVALLKRRVEGPLGLLVAPYKPAGARAPSFRLTREGCERWQFFRGQDAIAFFETKGVETGLAFYLEDIEGRKLFDTAGMLTPAGDAVYARALANMPAWWKSPSSGEVFGTRPPPKSSAPADPSSMPIALGPEHAALVDQFYRSSWAMHYQPTMLGRRLGRLNIIEEHDPRHSGPPGYLAVVGSEADKPAARKELRRHLGFLGSFDGDVVLTKAEKLAKIKDSVREVEARAGRKARLSLDVATVGGQIDKDLKGALAVVYVLLGPAQPEPPPQRPQAESPQPERPQADRPPPNMDEDYEPGPPKAEGAKGSSAPGGPEPSGSPAGGPPAAPPAGPPSAPKVDAPPSGDQAP